MSEVPLLDLSAFDFEILGLHLYNTCPLTKIATSTIVFKSRGLEVSKTKAGCQALHTLEQAGVVRAEVTALLLEKVLHLHTLTAAILSFRGGWPWRRTWVPCSGFGELIPRSYDPPAQRSGGSSTHTARCREN